MGYVCVANTYFEGEKYNGYESYVFFVFIKNHDIICPHDYKKWFIMQALSPRVLLFENIILISSTIQQTTKIFINNFAPRGFTIQHGLVTSDIGDAVCNEIYNKMLDLLSLFGIFSARHALNKFEKKWREKIRLYELFQELYNILCSVRNYIQFQGIQQNSDFRLALTTT